MIVEIKLNGRTRTFDVDPGEYLLDTLRTHHVLSVRKGCDESSCGVCTILLNDKPVLSCSVLSAQAHGKSILTVDGLHEEIEKISNYFSDEGADQCGFCNPGLALSTYALKQKSVPPTDAEIKRFIVGHLCRCSGYQAQYKAIKRYLGDHS